MPTAQPPTRPVTELLLEIAYHLHASRVVGLQTALGGPRLTDRSRPRGGASGSLTVATTPTVPNTPTAALAS